MKKSHATIAETHPDISYDDWCREEVKYKIYARKSTEDEGDKSGLLATRLPTARHWRNGLG